MRKLPRDQLWTTVKRAISLLDAVCLVLMRRIRFVLDVCCLPALDAPNRRFEKKQPFIEPAAPN